MGNFPGLHAIIFAYFEKKLTPLTSDSIFSDSLCRSQLFRKKCMYTGWGAHTFYPSVQGEEAGNLCEFEARLVHIASSKSAKNI